MLAHSSNPQWKLLKCSLFFLLIYCHYLDTWYLYWYYNVDAKRNPQHSRKWIKINIPVCGPFFAEANFCCFWQNNAATWPKKSYHFKRGGVHLQEEYIKISEERRPTWASRRICRINLWIIKVTFKLTAYSVTAPSPEMTKQRFAWYRFPFPPPWRHCSLTTGSPSVFECSLSTFFQHGITSSHLQADLPSLGTYSPVLPRAAPSAAASH